jgi:hypothetical protein
MGERAADLPAPIRAIFAGTDSGQAEPQAVERGVGFRAERRDIERGFAEFLQPIVSVGGKMDNLGPPLEDIDEGQEQGPVEAVRVKILRRAVRGCDQHQAALEQPAKQS